MHKPEYRYGGKNEAAYLKIYYLLDKGTPVLQISDKLGIPRKTVTRIRDEMLADKNRQ